MLGVEGVHRVGDRRGEHPARPQVRERTAQECRPVVEELQRLHRCDDQPEPPVQLERARVGDDRLDRQRAPAVRECGQQRGLDVQADHGRAGGGERERHAPCPGADVEHRASGLGGQREPERQVVAVVPALEVVPERFEVHPA